MGLYIFEKNYSIKKINFEKNIMKSFLTFIFLAIK
ncbi:MAG: hypothetical protein K0Q99_1752 [Clostridia bacterium]|jgi:hypothetical protein|nr:hypothetical protein [Clostridia bacterium]